MNNNKLFPKCPITALIKREGSLISDLLADYEESLAESIDLLITAAYEGGHDIEDMDNDELGDIARALQEQFDIILHKVCGLLIELDHYADSARKEWKRTYGKIEKYQVH